MSPQKLLVGLFICVFSLGVISAQDQAYLRMDAPTTALQTGQETIITITGQNLPGLWVGNMVIQYDPTAVYIMGTKAGSPITPGQALTAQPFTVVRNEISSDTLTYTFSLVNPAKPISGTVTLGTFRIYPLKAGPTELQFYSAQISSFTPPPDGQAVEASDFVDASFLPVLLNLEITGETVTAPSEATATPPPADTDVPPVAVEIQPTATGLVNVTAPPLEASTPTPQTPEPVPAASLPVLPIALSMIVIAILGLGGLYVSRRRR